MDSKLLALVAVLALFAAGSLSTSSTAQYTKDFEVYKIKHSKNYATAEEEAYRFAVYINNVEKINEQNDKIGSFTAAINQFTDMTYEEFHAKMLTYVPRKRENPENDFKAPKPESATIDWVSKGAVTAVKNQGQCGSCWSFSTTGGLEGANFLAGNTLTSYSEQYFVDCSTENAGCNGGFMFLAFQFAIDNGFCTEASYPYTGKDGSCHGSSCTKSHFNIKSYQNVTSGDTDSLEAALVKQPVSISVGANWSWQIYGGGILAAWECSTQLDHGVLLVGSADNYWKVKNSWGASWGEEGYIRLARPGDTCGLADDAQFPNF